MLFVAINVSTHNPTVFSSSSRMDDIFILRMRKKEAPPVCIFFSQHATHTQLLPYLIDSLELFGILPTSCRFSAEKPCTLLASLMPCATFVQKRKLGMILATIFLGTILALLHTLCPCATNTQLTGM